MFGLAIIPRSIASIHKRRYFTTTLHWKPIFCTCMLKLIIKGCEILHFVWPRFISLQAKEVKVMVFKLVGNTFQQDD